MEGVPSHSRGPPFLKTQSLSLPFRQQFVPPQYCILPAARPLKSPLQGGPMATASRVSSAPQPGHLTQFPTLFDTMFWLWRPLVMERALAPLQR